MRIKISVFLLVIIIYSCGREKSNKTANSDSVIRIDLLSEPESKITKLSEIAENVEYIPLQTTDSSLIGPFILKIINRENRIYVRNSGLEGEILCFDLVGKFLFKLHNKGRGPEEYLSITDFDVSSDNKTLVLLSDLNQKLLVYRISKTGFNFQRSISLKDPAPGRVSIIPETDKIFLAINP
jgi:hypothetical protein